MPITGAARGTYAVSYRVVSADGHPIRGSYAFHVGAPSTGGEAVDQARRDARATPGVERAFGFSRGVALFALLMIAGGICFSTLIAPGVRPRFIGDAILVAAVGLMASYVLDAANATGLKLTDVLTSDVLRAEASTTWGRSVLVQLVLLGLLVVWRRIVDLEQVRSARVAAFITIPAFAPLVAWSAGGHAIVADPVWLRWPLDVAHMCAAAIWIGGLVQLLRYVGDGGVSAEHIRRWSQVALWSVGTLVLTGLYAAWIEVGISREALTDTTYGRLVAVKMFLLLGVLPLAWLNKRHNVPALAGRTNMTRSDARRRLRSYVRGELFLLVLVIAATAALIQTPPARTQVDPDFYERVISLDDGSSAQVILDPSQQGPNEVHVYVFDANMQPDTAVRALTLTGSNRARDVDGYNMLLKRIAPHHYTNPSRVVPFSGRWTFELRIKRSKFEESNVTFAVKVGERE
jgi:copper transport protein